jgi:flagellar hook assembly protein FlgD
MKSFKLQWDNSLELNVILLFGTKPVLTNDKVTVTPALFFPEKGPQNISFTFSSYQSQSVNAVVKIMNLQSLSVLRTINQTVNAGTPNISWDGKADNGMWVAPGNYSVTVELTDSIGNKVKSQILTTVRY